MSCPKSRKAGHARAEKVYRYLQRKGLIPRESVPEKYRIVMKKQKV